MYNWIDTRPTLFEEEKAALESEGFKLDKDVLEQEQRVQFTGEVDPDNPRKIRLKFPFEYPSLPVRIIDESELPVLPQHHCYSSREFCLFGFNRDRWSSSSRALDGVREVLQLVEDPQASESAKLTVDDISSPEPISNQIKYAHGAFIIPHKIYEVLQTINNSSVNKLMELGKARIQWRVYSAPGYSSKPIRGTVSSIRITGEDEVEDNYFLGQTSSTTDVS